VRAAEFGTTTWSGTRRSLLAVLLTALLTDVEPYLYQIGSVTKSIIVCGTFSIFPHRSSGDLSLLKILKYEFLCMTYIFKLNVQYHFIQNNHMFQFLIRELLIHRIMQPRANKISTQIILEQLIA